MQLAKSLSTLDQLSGGRLILGAGMGGAGMQYERYGISSERIVRRFLESLEIMRKLWSEPSVSYEGDFWQMKHLSMEPKPKQHPHPPIWFGALHPNAIKRSVQYGEGWIGSASGTLTHFKQDVGRILQSLELAQRERSDFTIARQFRLAVDKNKARAKSRMQHYLAQVYDRWGAKSVVLRENPLFGSPQECVHRLSEFVSAGADVVILQPVFDQLEHAELLAEQIIPQVS